ncbi:MAG: dTDP-4-dehydrorhamnose reductase [Acidobacteriota bacterium]
MRGLVLGGGGMLGRAMAEWGRERGVAVLALDRARADIADPERLAYWVDRFRPQVVFNCAAYTQVDDCETERDHAFEINGRAVAHVAAAAWRVDASLVHVSTDYVFAGTADTPYREDDATAPRSVYGESKLAGEREALAYDRSLVVRASWLFGPGGPNFAATMMRLMDSGHQDLRVVDDQRGCPTYTPFLADALWRLAELGTTGVMHYRNREPVTWHGFTTEIARLWNPQVMVTPVTTDEFPRPAERPAYSVLDVSRFEAAVGERVPSWNDGLVQYLARLR